MQTCTLRDLVPQGAAATPEVDPDVARLKSSAEMVRAIEPAVRFYEEPPTEGMEVDTPYVDLWVSRDDWADAFDAAPPGTPHNEARDQVWEELLTILVSKVDRDDEDDEDDEDDDPDAAAALVRRSIAQNRELAEAFSKAWPLLDADDLVGDLWEVPAYLRLCAPWLSPTRSGCFGATTPAPGPSPTCRCWTPLGSGSATRRRPAASVVTRRSSRPSVSGWTASSRSSCSSTTRRA